MANERSGSGTRIQRGAVQSFESTQRQKQERKASKFLSEPELQDLLYLWHDYDSTLGVRSVQGAIQNRLMTAPPRMDARPHILSELERAGGRAPEGKVVSIVIAEGWGTRYEVRRSLTLLLAHGRVRREVSESQPGTLPEDWTGTDLVMGEVTRLALASVREPGRSRWQSQDDEVERMWREIPCGSGNDGYRNYAPDDVRQSLRADHILEALANMPDWAATVLRRVYGPRPRSVWASEWSNELGPLVELTEAVQAERRRMASEILAERRSVSLDLGRWQGVDDDRLERESLAAVSTADAVRSLLVSGQEARSKAVESIRREAEGLLMRASGEFRKARRKG